MDIKALTNDQLKDALNTAYGDLAEAVREQPESEWHEACFAATVLLCQEIERRGLTPICKH